MRTRSIFVAVVAAVLLLTGCGNSCNKEKSVLFGEVPNVVRELIKERIELNKNIDKARAAADKDKHMYLEAKDKDLRDEYATRFLAEGEKVKGNKLRAEAYDLPFEIVEHPRIVEAVYDSGLTVSGGYKFEFEYKVKLTEDVEATYYDEKEKQWYYAMHYLMVGVDGNILLIGSTSARVNVSEDGEMGGEPARVMPTESVTVMNDGRVIVGTRDAKSVDVPMVKAGSVLEAGFAYGFRFAGREAVLNMNKHDARLNKIMFLTEEEWRNAMGVWYKLLATGEEKEKKEDVKGTDRPEFYDEPYVVNTYPKDGDIVDSTLEEVRFSFNMPMNDGITVVGRIDGVEFIQMDADWDVSWNDERKLSYWLDEYTYAIKVTRKLESGKTYGVKLPKGMQKEGDYRKVVEGDCDVVFTVK